MFVRNSVDSLISVDLDVDDLFGDETDIEMVEYMSIVIFHVHDFLAI